MQRNLNYVIAAMILFLMNACTLKYADRDFTSKPELTQQQMDYILHISGSTQDIASEEIQKISKKIHLHLKEYGFRNVSESRNESKKFFIITLELNRAIDEGSQGTVNAIAFLQLMAIIPIWIKHYYHLSVQEIHNSRLINDYSYQNSVDQFMSLLVGYIGFLFPGNYLEGDKSLDENLMNALVYEFISDVQGKKGK